VGIGVDQLLGREGGGAAASPGPVEEIRYLPLLSGTKTLTTSNAQAPPDRATSRLHFDLKIRAVARTNNLANPKTVIPATGRNDSRRRPVSVAGWQNDVVSA
jgi:hypothetical protein